MSGSRLDDSLWLLSRASGAARIARLVILVSPILATVCTTLAAGRPFVIGSAVIVILAAACVVFPDTHLGLIVIVVLAAEWVIRVQDPVSPWSIGVAALIGVFHTALAFTGIAPAGADLADSMYLPWIRRALISTGPAGAVWAAVVALDRVDFGRQAVLVAAALVVLAIAGYWSAAARSRTDEQRQASSR